MSWGSRWWRDPLDDLSHHLPKEGLHHAYGCQLLSSLALALDTWYVWLSLHCTLHSDRFSFSLTYLGTNYFKRMYLKIFWAGIVLVLILMLTLHPFLLTKLTEASKSQKNDSKFSTKTKGGGMLRFWNVLVLVLVLNFESIFCDLLASVSLVNKNGCKGKH